MIFSYRVESTEALAARKDYTLQARDGFQMEAKDPQKAVAYPTTAYTTAGTARGAAGSFLSALGPTKARRASFGPSASI